MKVPHILLEVVPESPICVRLHNAGLRYRSLMEPLCFLKQEMERDEMAGVYMQTLYNTACQFVMTSFQQNILQLTLALLVL